MNSSQEWKSASSEHFSMQQLSPAFIHGQDFVNIELSENLNSVWMNKFQTVYEAN